MRDAQLTRDVNLSVRVAAAGSGAALLAAMQHVVAPLAGGSHVQQGDAAHALAHRAVLAFRNLLVVVQPPRHIFGAEAPVIEHAADRHVGASAGE